MSEPREDSCLHASATEIEDRAAEFLQQRRFWKWTEEEQARLDAWLNESLAHRAAFWRLEAGLNRTERLSALRPSAPGEARRWSLRVLTRVVAGVATVAALSAMTALYIYWPSHGQTYATGIGGHKIIALSDGSKIELNTDSIVRVDVAANHRIASLDRGEAYFQIAHADDSPFVVTANDRRITVLGTKFSVRADTNSTEVTLFEGRVWFSSRHSASAANAALLTPGDVLVATAKSTSITRKSAGDLTKMLGWRRGVLVFGNTALADAATEFNRYNRQKIIVADSTVGEIRVGGTFPATDVDDFTRLVRSVLGLHVEKHVDEIVISR
jgi:transmembrane sensor